MFSKVFLTVTVLLGCLLSAPVLADGVDAFASSPDVQEGAPSVVADAISEVPAAGSTVNMSMEVKSPDSVVVTVSSPSDLVAEIAAAAGIVGGLIFGLVFALMEAAKGFIRGFAKMSDTKKRSWAILGGGVVGAAISFIPAAGITWYVGLIVGLLGGAGATYTRAIGKNGPARSSVIAIVCVCVLGLAGCGTTFTVRNGDPVTFDMKVSQPSYVAAYVKGVETCKINNPEGTIKIKNLCGVGLVSTMAEDGTEPTCVPNPCLTGKFVFLPSGHTACQ